MDKQMKIAMNRSIGALPLADIASLMPKPAAPLALAPAEYAK